MMQKEKFKYGPLIWNSSGDEDDDGNYYWAGMPPVAYDAMEIPVDMEGRQCLPMTCPFHPHYEFKDKQTSKYDPTVQLPLTFKEYKDWLEKNFIVFDEKPVKKDIVKKVVSQLAKANASTQMGGGEYDLQKMARLVIKELEEIFGTSFTVQGIRQEENINANT